MNKQRLSGIVLIASIVMMVLSGIIFPLPNLYQETDIDVRMQIVEQGGSNFTNAQIITIVAVAGMAVGYLLLTLHLQGEKTARLANFGAAAMIIAAISITIYLLIGISDPRAYLDRAARESSGIAIYLQGFAYLAIAGYLLYGVVFLRAGFPKWLAYFTLGFTTLVLFVVIFIEIFAVELLFFLMPLIVGIVLLRRSKAVN